MTENAENHETLSPISEQPKIQEPFVPLVPQEPMPNTDAAAENIRETLLVDDVVSRGQMAVFTAMSANLGRSRGVGTGFKNIYGKEFPRGKRGPQFQAQIQYAFGPNNSILDVLKKENLSAAVSLEPLTRKTPVYETAPDERGVIGRMFKDAPQPRQTGDRIEPISMQEFQANESEQAYRINLVITGTTEKPYRDQTTRREGNVFIGGIVLSKSLAERTYQLILQDPKVCLRLFQKMDPELMESQKGFMPDINKMLVVPIENPLDAFTMNDRKMAIGVKPEYVKECLS